MAKVYKTVGGKKLTKIIAMHGDVQDAVDDAAQEGAIRAAALLDARSKHRTGTSSIDVDKGRVDAYVVLDDTRGLSAALSIEYGRGEIETKDGKNPPTAGIFALHDAFGLEHGE